MTRVYMVRLYVARFYVASFCMKRFTRVVACVSVLQIPTTHSC